MGEGFSRKQRGQVWKCAGSLNARLGEDGPAWFTNQGLASEKQTRKNEDKEHTCSSEWHLGHV